MARITARSTSSKRGCLTLTSLKAESRAFISGVMLISDTPHSAESGSNPASPLLSVHAHQAQGWLSCRVWLRGWIVLQDRAVAGGALLLRRSSPLRIEPGAD